jgi:hypothetical protein
MFLISTSQIDLAVVMLDDSTTPVPQTTARNPLVALLKLIAKMISAR